MTSVLAADLRPARGVAVAALVICGPLVLALRPYALGDPPAVAVLAATYAILLAVAVVAPVPHADRGGSIAPAAALVAGLAVVGAVWVVVGRPPPAPSAALAIPFGVLAAVAEEALFRRFLYGWLSRAGGALAMVVSALLFALVHVPAYGWAAFPIDLGAGLFLSWQRYASGSWALPAATHVAANLLAGLA